MGIEKGDGVISCAHCWRRLGYGEGPICDKCKTSAKVQDKTKELKAENVKLQAEIDKLKENQ